MARSQHLSGAADDEDHMTDPRDDAVRGDQDAAVARPPATPTWVKALGIALAVLVLLVLAKALLGGSLAGHGPGLHGG